MSQERFNQERVRTDFKLHRRVFHNGYAAGLHGVPATENPHANIYLVLAEKWEEGRQAALEDLQHLGVSP